MKAHLVIKLQSFDDMLKRKGVSLTERKEDWGVIFWWSMEEEDCTLQMFLSNNKVKQHKNESVCSPMAFNFWGFWSICLTWWSQMEKWGLSRNHGLDDLDDSNLYRCYLDSKQSDEVLERQLSNWDSLNKPVVHVLFGGLHSASNLLLCDMVQTRRAS